MLASAFPCDTASSLENLVVPEAPEVLVVFVVLVVLEVETFASPETRGDVVVVPLVLHLAQVAVARRAVVADSGTHIVCNIAPLAAGVRGAPGVPGE